MSQQLVDAITGMREEDALKITKELLEGGTSPFDILGACSTAMDVIGGRFEKGEAFIPELILAGEVLTQISDMLKPVMDDGEGQAAEKLGKIVIGTVEGDIHDIAKDIVAFMLEINGFDVTDLGVDVPPAKFVEATKETGATIVGLSGFLTLAYDPMKETVAALKGAGLDDVKVMIGGGQVDEQIRAYTGADAYGRDAMAAVTLAKQWIGG
ncbi:MAG: methionine synthase [Chloroflexi bacterium]|nr:MAG: methionine synthase [Anaerolineaceae bacterium 4572_32.1]RLC79905.1 MAG: methionine synthase [Chloroflexota bacterium]RLC86137.1 MAG: methionine synthase [Chloroflexota bacterium]HEY74257.1 methionine synthase [Thermoflexia bacterium]